MKATHSDAKNGRRLLLVGYSARGLAVFDDLDASAPTRTECPMTPEYVLPYADKSEVIDA